MLSVVWTSTGSGAALASACRPPRTPDERVLLTSVCVPQPRIVIASTGPQAGFRSLVEELRKTPTAGDFSKALGERLRAAVKADNALKFVGAFADDAGTLVAFSQGSIGLGENAQACGEAAESIAPTDEAITRADAERIMTTTLPPGVPPEIAAVQGGLGFHSASFVNGAFVLDHAPIAGMWLANLDGTTIARLVPVRLSSVRQNGQHVSVAETLFLENGKAERRVYTAPAFSDVPADARAGSASETATHIAQTVIIESDNGDLDVIDVTRSFDAPVTFAASGAIPDDVRAVVTTAVENFASTRSQS